MGYTNAYSTFSQSAIVDLNTDDLLRGGVSFPANLNVEGHMKLGGSNKELRFYEGTNYVGFEGLQIKFGFFQQPMELLDKFYKPMEVELCLGPRQVVVLWFTHWIFTVFTQMMLQLLSL